MKKKALTCLILITLCFSLILPAGMSETRTGVIYLEGMEETIEETLFECPQGFSFWYASSTLEAYLGEAGGIEGAVVRSLYMDDDYMVISVIPQEDAEEYAREINADISKPDTRVQEDVYLYLEQGRYHFLTLIAENGRYLSAMGEYSQEAAEGTAKYFDRVLSGVTFGTSCLFSAQWGESDPEEEGAAQVILTALEPVADVRLLRLDWDGAGFTRDMEVPMGSFGAQQQVSLMLSFAGDMPAYGITYTDGEGAERAYALDISGEDGTLFFFRLDE